MNYSMAFQILFFYDGRTIMAIYYSSECKPIKMNELLKTDFLLGG